MDQDKQNKRIHIATIIMLIITIILIILAIILTLRNHNKKNPENVTTESTEAATISETASEESTGNAAEGNTESSSSESSSGSSSESASTEITDSNLQAISDLTAHMKDYPANGESTTIQAGNMSVTFNNKMANAKTGTFNGMKAVQIVYNDGNEAAVKGLLYALDPGISDQYPSSVDEAKAWVGEYLAAGTGESTSWDETEHYYINKSAVYDRETDSADVVYIALPKDSTDKDVYIIGYENSGKTTEGTPISESSYISMMQPFVEMVGNNKIANTDYDAAADELAQIKKDKTASGEIMESLKTLEQANEAYEKKVYGENADQLTEEEKEELYWKYEDPTGYAQAKEQENKAYDWQNEKPASKDNLQGAKDITGTDSSTEAASEN